MEPSRNVEGPAPSKRVINRWALAGVVSSVMGWGYLAMFLAAVIYRSMPLLIAAGVVAVACMGIDLALIRRKSAARP